MGQKKSQNLTRNVQFSFIRVLSHCDSGVAVSINSLILVYSLNQLLYKTSKTHYNRYSKYIDTYSSTYFKNQFLIDDFEKKSTSHFKSAPNAMQCLSNLHKIYWRESRNWSATSQAWRLECFLINVVLETIILIILRLTWYSISYFIST